MRVKTCISMVVAVISCMIFATVFSASASELGNSELNSLLSLADDYGEVTDSGLKIELLTATDVDLEWKGHNEYVYQPVIVTYKDVKTVEIGIKKYEGYGLRLQPCKDLSPLSEDEKKAGISYNGPSDKIRSAIYSLANKNGYKIGDLNHSTVIYKDGIQGYGVERLDLNGIKYIDNYALRGVSGIDTLVVPPSVVVLGTGVFRETGFKTVEFQCPINTITGYMFADSDIRNIKYDSATSGSFTVCEGAFMRTNIENIMDVFPTNIEKLSLTLKYRAFYDCDNLESIKFPSNTKKIGSSVFHNCDYITDITFNTGLQSIGVGAFANNISLISVNTIPSTVNNSLGMAAFWGCTKLASLELPSSISYVPDGLCVNCSSLKRVALGVVTKEIGFSAFANCSALVEVANASKVVTINECAFDSCSSLPAPISKSGSLIGAGAYAECTSLTGVDISFTSIEDEAFTGCTNLGAVRVSTDNLGVKAFADSGITNMVFGKSPKYIADCCFVNCSKLTTVSGIDSACQEVGKQAFLGCSKLQSVTDLFETDVLGEEAFCNCTSLTRISKQAAMNMNLFTIGDRCFYNCSKLTQGISAYINEIGTEAFYNTKITNLIIFNTQSDAELKIGDRAFANCKSLKTVEISWVVITNAKDYTDNGRIITLGNEVFSDCTSLERAVIDGNVELDLASMTLGDYLFSGCTKLKTVKIAMIDCFSSGKLVKSGTEMFRGVTSLQEVAYGGREIPSGMFMGANPTKYLSSSGVVVIDENGNKVKKAYNKYVLNAPFVTVIGDKAFYNSAMTFKDSKVTKNITSIGSLAFAHSCVNSFIFGDTVTVSGEGTFVNCQLLESVYNTPKLLKGMFAEDSQLKAITLKKGVSVTSIPAHCFANCQSLFNTQQSDCVTINSLLFRVTTIGDYAFEGCRQLTSISMIDKAVDGVYPVVKRKIGNYAFYGCDNLSTLKFFGLSIGDYAFASSKLDSAILSVESIGEGAFVGCAFRNGNQTTATNKRTKNSKVIFYNTPFELKLIGDFAFENVNSMNYIAVPSTVQHLGDYSFGCKCTANFEIKNAKSEYKVWTCEFSNHAVILSPENSRAFYIHEKTMNQTTKVEEGVETVVTTYSYSDPTSAIIDDYMTKYNQSYVDDSAYQELITGSGDTDLDGVLDSADCFNLGRVLTSAVENVSYTRENSDLNGDGVVNVIDWIILKRKVAK